MRYIIFVLAIVLFGCSVDTSPSSEEGGVGSTISGEDIEAYWAVQGAWLLMGFDYDKECESRLFSIKVWRSDFAHLVQTFPEWEGNDHEKTLRGAYIPKGDVDFVWLRTDRAGGYPEKQILYHELIHYMQGCTGHDSSEHPESMFGMNGTQKNVLSCALEPNTQTCMFDNETEGNHD